ncbi:hypothetical protein DL96DRAFT_1572208 [Flagelloscypha sp. PMI_526]|nr:hypothetical protein DL96DRAFT_1572208 [Flagelloscypha sp. PMI_526]
MKGFTKAIKRTPHMVTTKVGMSKNTLLKETKTYMENVNSMVLFITLLEACSILIMSPMNSEYALESKNPDAAHTIGCVDKFESALEELRLSVGPELELIETRIVAPAKEFQTVLKTIRKTVTKRQHKLTDYDRFNQSLTKLRDKKEKSMSDEKNLFRLEQEFEQATQEYDFINTALKTDLPNFVAMTTQFIDPLFHSYYFMQLQIYYLLLEKLSSFAEENQYEVANMSGPQIQGEYEEKRTDAWAQIEEMNITKRIISVSKLVQQNRAAGGGVSRANTTASTSSSLSSRSGSTFSKKPPPPPPASKFGKAPPPPPSSGSSFTKAPPPAPSFKPAAPPPYQASPTSPSPSSSAMAAAKKAPPPPPPLKPKPSLVKKKDVVVALYDFDAQAEGDLSFRAGDRIEIVKRSPNTEDWWTGRLESDGSEGVFPGNYVQDA